MLSALALAGCTSQEPAGRSIAGPARPDPSVIVEVQPQPEDPPPWMRTATVTGQVVDRQGPVAGAELTLSAQLGTSTLDLGPSRSDEQGVFHFREAPPGAAVLQCTRAGFARARITFWLEPGRNQAPQLTLEPEAVVSGRVVGNEGEPVAHATVRASSAGQPDLHFSGKSDLQGKFTINGLGRGPVALAAEAPGYQLAAEPRIDAPDTRVVLRLSRVFQLQGTVSGLQPGYKVTVWLAGSGVWPAWQTAVDASGRFAFANLPEGVYELVARTATAPWGASRVMPEVVIGPKPPRELRLTLKPAYRLSGTVVQGTRPVPGATVVASAEALAVLQEQVVTDDKGRFSLAPVPQGRYFLSAWAKGYLPEIGKEIEVPGAKSLTLSLELGSQVSGIVQDDEGYPVEGVIVRAMYRLGAGGVAGSFKAPPGPLGELGVVPGPVPPIPPASLPGRGPVDLGPASLTAVTDRQGKFLLRGLPPGSLRLVAEHPDYLQDISPWLEARSGDSLSDEMLFKLSLGGRVQGAVLDNRGAGLIGAEVVAQGEKVTRTAYTGEGGRFVLSGLERRVRLTVGRPGYLPAERTLELQPGKLKTVDLVLASAEGQLAGMVRDGFGVPLAGVRLEAARGGHRVTAMTDVEGRFRLQGVGQPPFELTAAKQRFAQAKLLIRDTNDVEITLQQLVSLAGQVLELRAGTGVVDYRLRIQGSGMMKEKKVHHPAGRFLVEGLPPGELKVTVQAPGFVSSQQAIDLPAASAAPGFPLQEVRFELQQAGAAFGQLTDASGAPVHGAEVRVANRRTLTDEAGQFQLAELPEGTHPLEVVTLEQGAASLDPVVIRARETSGPLRLMLP